MYTIQYIFIKNKQIFTNYYFYLQIFIFSNEEPLVIEGEFNLRYYGEVSTRTLGTPCRN